MEQPRKRAKKAGVVVWRSRYPLSRGEGSVSFGLSLDCLDGSLRHLHLLSEESRK